MSTSPTSSIRGPEETTSEPTPKQTYTEGLRSFQAWSNDWSPMLYVRLAMKRHMRALLTGRLEAETFLDLMEFKIEEAISMKENWEAKS